MKKRSEISLSLELRYSTTSTASNSKESEIINLQKHINIVQQNKERLIKDYSNFWEQLKIQGNENELKQIINSLNEKLEQLIALNRL